MKPHFTHENTTGLSDHQLRRANELVDRYLRRGGIDPRLHCHVTEDMRRCYREECDKALAHVRRDSRREPCECCGSTGLCARDYPMGRDRR